MTYLQVGSMFASDDIRFYRCARTQGQARVTLLGIKEWHHAVINRDRLFTELPGSQRSGVKSGERLNYS